MNRKIIGTSGYYIGYKICNWNRMWNGILNFMSWFAVWLGIVAILAMIVFILTLPAWV